VADEMPARRNPWIWAGAGAFAAAAAGVSAQRRHMRRIAADPENESLRDTPRGEELSITSSDGTVLHAEVFGSDREDATTFVLAHGWTEALRYWTYVIRELSGRGFRVVAYDLRGHGDSDPAVDADYAIGRFGEDLEAVLRRAVPDGRRAIVAGHSLGAMSIVAWAEHHEVHERVAAVALLNTGVGDLMAEHLLIPVPWIAQFLNSAVPPRYSLGSSAPLPRFSTPLGYAAVRYIAFGPAATPAQIAFYERMLITCPPDVRAKVGIALSELELYDALPRLTLPTLVIAGEDDKLTPPSHARRIAEMVPQLERLIVLRETGHMTPLERPAEVSEALVDLAAVAAGERATALAAVDPDRRDD
jgi:pimeloyl-ACP methyl ester carboxylesterase